MVGDSWDDIGGLGGIGGVKGRKMVDEGRIEKFIGESKKKEYVEIWKRNEELMEVLWFVRDNGLDKLGIKWKKKFKYEKLKEVCME